MNHPSFGNVVPQSYYVPPLVVALKAFWIFFLAMLELAALASEGVESQNGVLSFHFDG